MKRIDILFACVVVASSLVPEAMAGGCRRSVRRGYQASCPTYAPVQAVYPQAPRTLEYPVHYQASPQSGYYPASPQSADAYGFTSWINGVRASRGLRSLAWSADLAAHAAINSARGFGHSYMGGTRRQNCGMGALATVESSWLQSPAHLAAILDPSCSEVGLAYVGGVWTMNAR